jgi:hypothetical protein
MPFSIEVGTTRRFEVARDYETVFDTLADVPYSAAEFPKLRELVHLGDETYRWVMEPISLAAFTAQTIYVCAYSWDKEERWIAWEPVEDVVGTTALIQGRWDLEAKGPESTGLIFHSQGTITLPFPALAKVVVGPLASAEFDQLVGGYIRNLKTFWEHD